MLKVTYGLKNTSHLRREGANQEITKLRANQEMNALRYDDRKQSLDSSPSKGHGRQQRSKSQKFASVRDKLDATHEEAIQLRQGRVPAPAASLDNRDLKSKSKGNDGGTQPCWAFSKSFGACKGAAPWSNCRQGRAHICHKCNGLHNASEASCPMRG